MIFASSGGMMTNNWETNQIGQAYRSWLGAAGRPDVLEWARSVLAPRGQAVFEDFSKRYGWGDAGSLDFSEAPARPSADGLQDGRSVRGSAGLLARACGQDPGYGSATTAEEVATLHTSPR